MYKEFYGLTTYPFAFTADPELYYSSETHAHCLSSLLHSLERECGLIVLTGEVGTGKTLLLNTLMKSLGKKIHVAFLGHAKLDSRELLQYAFHEFRVDTAGKSTAELLMQLRDFLLSHEILDEHVVLILDEAQISQSTFWKSLDY